MNGKCPVCTKKMYSLLTPKGKTGPLEYNDVVSEIWHHDNVKAINSITILVDNNVPFQIKDGGVALVFLTNKKLKKVKDAIEKNPRIISRYMKRKEMEKIEKHLLSSSNYELVKTGMSSEAYFAKKGQKPNKSYRRRKPYRNPNYKQSSNTSLLIKTTNIKNDVHRLRYIKEEVFSTGDEKIPYLFDVMLDLYMGTKFTDKDIVDILSGLSSKNNVSGIPTKLFHRLHADGKGKSVRQISKHWDIDVWKEIAHEISFGNDSHPSISANWLVDYLDLISPVYALRIVPIATDDTYILALLNIYPDLLDEITTKYPDKLPQSMQDIFMF
jgi:hypothetical protein